MGNFIRNQIPRNQLFEFDANMAILPVSSPAEAISRNEHLLVAYDDSIVENTIYHGVMSRDYNAGNILIDLHWISATVTSGDVVWAAAFERIADRGHDIDVDSFAEKINITATTSDTSGIVKKTTIILTQAQADSIKANDAFRIRVQRVATDAEDTMIGDAQLLRVSGGQ